MNRQTSVVIALFAASALAQTEELLQDYAAKCDEAVGLSVPDFDCDSPFFNTVPTTGYTCDAFGCRCDRPNVLNGVCDPWSKSKIIAQNATAFVVANCRKNGEPYGNGLYSDIAVIQHNTVNGATCFYQAGLANSHAALVRAPLLGVGTPKAWMTPREIRNSSFPCIGCHDNGAIIRSPYLTQLGPAQFPGVGSDTFNSASSPYFLVGAEFGNWRSYSVSIPNTNNTCLTCHRLGVSNQKVGGVWNGTARKFARIATASSQASKNPHSAQSPLWMLRNQISFSQANFDSAVQVEACANQFTTTGPLPNGPNCTILPINLFTRAPGKTLNGSMFSVWRPSDGVWSIIKQTDSDRLFEQWGQDGDVPVPGDYDMDGLVDIATWRKSDGVWYVIRSSDGATFAKQWGADGDIPVPADYDGDGFTDFAVWRKSSGFWFILKSTLNYDYSHPLAVQWGQNGDVPVPARYDTVDAKADIAIWRRSEGFWYVLPSHGGLITRQWGAAEDTPVPADFDGDGDVEFTVWRPSEGYWYMNDVATNVVTTMQWGAAEDTPVPGRYVGNDSRADFAVWRPSEGYWYIKNSFTGVVTTKQWGRAGDKAIAPSP